MGLRLLRECCNITCLFYYAFEVFFKREYIVSRFYISVLFANCIKATKNIPTVNSCLNYPKYPKKISNLPTSSRPLTNVFFGLVFVLRARKDDDDHHHCVYASVFAKKTHPQWIKKKTKETLIIFSTVYINPSSFVTKVTRQKLHF